MIVLKSVAKKAGHARHLVLTNATGVFETREHYVILGAKGSGKSTLLALLCGTQKPMRGSVTRHGTVGLPLGRANVSRGWQSGYSLAQFIAELYDADPKEIIDFTARFSGLGDTINMPLTDMHKADRQRLLYALGYAIPVDTYLFDNGNTSTGNPDFRRQCVAAFEERRRRAGTIVALADSRRARQFGERGVVLHDGQLYFYDTLDEAIEVYERHELNSQFGTLNFVRTLLRKKDYDGARRYLTEYQSLHPHDVGGYELLAGLAFKAGDHSQAMAASSAVIAQSPNNLDAHLILGKVAVREKRYHDAIAHAEEALLGSPDNTRVTALLTKATTAVELEQKPTVRQRLPHEQEAASSEDRVKSWNQTIRAEAKARNWHKVLEALRLATAETEESEAWLDLRIRALFETGRFAETQESILALARQNMDRAQDYVRLVARKQHTALTADILKHLQAHDADLLSSPVMRGVIKFIEREARTAAEKGDIEQAKTLNDLLAPAVINETKTSPKEDTDS